MPEMIKRHPIRASLISVLLLSLVLGACLVSHQLPDGPIPQARYPAPSGATAGPLVIVLPGIQDDMDSLQDSGMVEQIQRANPDATVILAAASFGYYMDRSLLERLQSEIIKPALAEGFTDIWMAGASLGGFGTLLYEREHPGFLSGLVLMAPFTGRKDLAKSIDKAGGLRQWEPGPAPPVVHPDDVPHEIWRMLKGFADDPERARRVWLICGDKDKFHLAAEQIAEVIPDSHYYEPRGGHVWRVWAPAAGHVFHAIFSGRQAATD
ncbi:hypothetical protein DEH80_11865 [Abyssibacter profundi]|uniref:Alpha/beta hydrolase n=2 Tax=Abyssibacter profundi TaxID=2182787 RepID=A0A363UJ85_9GAMM|nr:hypothetical protein DEH80_11865 [Abyssibacter profundi]